MSPREQRAPLGPVQHLAALEVAAAADERQPAAEVVRLAVPELDRTGRAAAPTRGRRRAGRIGQREGVRPLDHRRVVVRVRDRDRREPALAPRSRSTISSSRYGMQSQSTLPGVALDEQRALADREATASHADPEDAVVVADVRRGARCGTRRTSSQSWPSSCGHVLARVLADRAGARRLVARRVLRPAGLADERRHVVDSTVASRSSSATHSTCGVCGNMSTGRARTSR